jgi:hypothetical protein
MHSSCLKGFVWKGIYFMQTTEKGEEELWSEETLLSQLR